LQKSTNTPKHNTKQTKSKRYINSKKTAVWIEYKCKLANNIGQGEIDHGY